MCGGGQPTRLPFFVNVLTRRLLPRCGRQTLSGLLSLGYQMGATMHRRRETWIKGPDELAVTVVTIAEIPGTFLQIKGRDRNAVLRVADDLGVNEQHVPQNFLTLYFRTLRQTGKDA